MADPGGSVTNQRDILRDRILNHIAREDLAKVDLNAGLRNIKDNALAYEIAAEELLKDIQEAYTKAKWRIQMADGVKEQKNQARGHAYHDEWLTQAEFSPWREQYDAMSREQYQALQKAKNATQQAENEYAQASEGADRCRKVAMHKKHLGMLAIRVILDDQQRHTLEAADRICETLDVQQEANDGEASAAQA